MRASASDVSGWSSGDRAELVLGVLRAVRGFGDAHDRMAGSLRHGMGMNASDVMALRLLIIMEERGSVVTPREIARHLRISTASTTKLLDRLTASGHVVREPHPSDRRARIVRLTQASRVEFFRLYGPRLAAIREALEPFGDDELESAVRLIEAVGAALAWDAGGTESGGTVGAAHSNEGSDRESPTPRARL